MYKKMEIKGGIAPGKERGEGHGQGWDRTGRRKGRRGRKKKALTDRINDGGTAMVLDLPEPSEMSGEEMPLVKDYLKAKQKSGKSFCAAEVYEETWKWLRERGCDRLVNIQLVEQYAVSVSGGSSARNAFRSMASLPNIPRPETPSLPRMFPCPSSI